MKFEREIELNGKKKEQVKFKVQGRNKKVHLKKNRKKRSKQQGLEQVGVRDPNQGGLEDY